MLDAAQSLHGTSSSTITWNMMFLAAVIGPKSEDVDQRSEEGIKVELVGLNRQLSGFGLAKQQQIVEEQSSRIRASGLDRPEWY